MGNVLTNIVSATRSILEANILNKYPYGNYFPVTKKTGITTFIKDKVSFSIINSNTDANKVSAYMFKKNRNTLYPANLTANTFRDTFFIGQFTNVTYDVEQGNQFP
jgi:hypothetical protein